MGYPQGDGATEVTKRTNLQGLKKWLDNLKGKWLEELPNILWSYRTTTRTATRETSFNLCFGVDAVVPAEIGSKSLQSMALDEHSNDQMLYEHLTLIDEIRKHATKRDNHYRKQVV